MTVIQEDQGGVRQGERDIARVLSAYRGVYRVYASIRFRIIHLRFLEEIAQYLPDQGEMLDLGCGFGLFAIYMALSKPSSRVVGLDVNARRLATARAAAARLGVTNVFFEQEDLRTWRPGRSGLAAAYALDVFHHLPVETGNYLLRELFARLEPGGRLLFKDVDTKPRWMLGFTWLLDLFMSPRDHLAYRSAAVWRRQLAESGFDPVYCHYLWDVLPYPHILFVCGKPALAPRVA